MYLESLQAGDRHSETLIAVFYPSEEAVTPTSTTAHVTATFSTTSGEPRNASIQIQLPMCLFCKLIPPVKNAGEIPHGSIAVQLDTQTAWPYCGGRRHVDGLLEAR
jgi:hypothetical protein